MTNQSQRYTEFRNALRERVLVLDGSMGVLVQRLHLSEDEFRGSRFLSHPRPLAGDVDLLNITAEQHIRHIHRAYLEAGADIIETNTFNSNALSQEEYGLSGYVKLLNTAGARLAREEADRAMQLQPGRVCFVAGSMGPTAMSASLPCDVEDPTSRSVDFDTLSDAAFQQASALIEGGVDLLLLETAFDALNVRAQLHGIARARHATGADTPVVISLTLSDASGRLLSGHTPEAMLAIVESFAPDAVGFNCGAGPASLSSHVRNLAAISPYPVIFYPNAGLPDRLGRYSETPEAFVSALKPLIESGELNIVGGCCGTDTGHIAALAKVVNGARPHTPGNARQPWLAGLEAFADDRGFINVGERCNVAGSRKFLRLINEGNREEALAIARRQVENGAQIIDINVDDGMLDSVAEMRSFLRLLGSDPATSSVPWMIDSSSFEVIETALKNVAGKPVVNSISLKHGEEEFLRHARIIRSYGAAVVVMAFDEKGQADTFERKIEVCARAYRLLTEKASYDPRDIIFDPNVLTVATGMAEHDRYGIDFIRAVEWIKKNLPGAKTSGGLSNLSFAFRGNNYVRQAMHAVFLYHAIAVGFDMAIMDPGAKVTYDDIPAQLLERIEDVILVRTPDATEKLLEIAADYAAKKDDTAATTEPARPADVDDRLILALRTGDDSGIEDDLQLAVERHNTANAVVEGPLMAGMELVGKLFESGKMFLPQVVKSARVMHRAVEILRPLLEAGAASTASKGTLLIATVKGDVHDIGKNIVGVVMRCNNFEVVDLGVQVDAARIVSEAIRLQPDAIALSGLISPSLDEMANVAEALQRAGLRIPLMVGGAATSELHTAVKIAPKYDGIVIRLNDAAQNPVALSRIMADPEGEAARIAARQEDLRQSLLASADATAGESLRPEIDWTNEPVFAPARPGVTHFDNIPVAWVRPYINWIYFNHCWKVKPESIEAETLRNDAEQLLNRLERDGASMRAIVALHEAWQADDDDAIIINGIPVPTPRQKASDTRSETLSLCDFVAPKGYHDTVGTFMVTVGDRLRSLLDDSSLKADDYSHLLLQSLCDRLAEAASEWLHHRTRTSLWGYAPDEDDDLRRILRQQYQGIRPAVGYPSLPDQMLMHTLARIVNPADIDVTVTENGALTPSSTVAGFYIASPRARYFSV